MLTGNETVTMSDTEIIHALGCCIPTYNKKCDYCVYRKYKSASMTTRTCSSRLRQDVLNLINRQQVENEKLQKHIEKCDTVERCADELIAQLQKELKTAKSEAVKEFAERLKAEMLKSKYSLTVSPYSRACNAVLKFWVEEIDNFVKEMGCSDAE